MTERTIDAHKYDNCWGFDYERPRVTIDLNGMNLNQAAFDFLLARLRERSYNTEAVDIVIKRASLTRIPGIVVNFPGTEP